MAQLQEVAPNILKFDICDRAYAREVLEDDMAKNGAYYGIVCNAGITRDNAFPALSAQDWDSVIHTDLDGFFNVVQPLTMPMVRAKKGGRIVTVSSVSGVMGNRGQVNYSAAKAGLIGATKALAVELATRQITVNCVAPGFIETDMTASLPEAQQQALLGQIPLGHLGKPEDIAHAVSYLASGRAGYVTGQEIHVNGGMYM